ADAGSLGDVLDQFHLPAVVPHAVNVVALAGAFQQAHLLDAGRDAVDQHVFAALGRVDELEAPVRVVGRVGGQVVRDGAGVAVVPVADPGEGAAGGQVHGVAAAAEFLRAEQDPPAQRAVDFVQFAGVHRGRLAGPAGQREE